MISKLNKLSELLSVAKTVKSSNKWVDCGKITSSQAKKILESTGIDVSGYSRVIELTNVRHILNNHGTRSKDPYPVDSEELLLVPFILANPDKIIKSKSNSKSNSLEIITSIKAIGDKYLYVEEVRTGRKKLALKTFYKKRARK
jgi:hypothetical protein